MIDSSAIKHAARVVGDGGLVAYPTEAVYGLGCDPLREDAVNRLLALKNRNWELGLIVIASDFGQIRSMIDTSNEDAVKRARATWPGPVTWVFPARPHLPAWLTGGRATLAVRVTAHPVAHALCAALGRGLVSTSANRSGEPPAVDADGVRGQFGDAVDVVVTGEVGGQLRPTEIRDAMTGEVIRAG